MTLLSILSLIPFRERPMPFDRLDRSGALDRAERLAIETVQELTRFRRGVMVRHGHRIARFRQDPDVIKQAADLHHPGWTGAARVLPMPPVPEISIDKALTARRSGSRSRLCGPVDDETLGKLLALSVKANASVPVNGSSTVSFGLRPYPSAGALYPCELYVVRPDEPACRYDARNHALLTISKGPLDFRDVETLPASSPPPCALVISARLGRTTAKYAGRGFRFALLEAGHISQNLLLCAAALGLPALAYGSFYDRELERALQMDGIEEVALAVVLVGSECTDAKGNTI